MVIFAFEILSIRFLCGVFISTYKYFHFYILVIFKILIFLFLLLLLTFIPFCPCIFHPLSLIVHLPFLLMSAHSLPSLLLSTHRLLSFFQMSIKLPTLQSKLFFSSPILCGPPFINPIPSDFLVFYSFSKLKGKSIISIILTKLFTRIKSLSIRKRKLKSSS